MNDDSLSPKIQQQPVPATPVTPVKSEQANPGQSAVPNDTEEQDTVSDRVFDFSDGDIKPVKDVDGPVTHSVNLKIAEALRNPTATIKKEPINKLEVVEKPVLQNTQNAPVPAPVPAPIPAPPSISKPIPHPPIDPKMQAPAVRVYSQIPHESAQPTTPTQPAAPAPVAEEPSAAPIAPLVGPRPNMAPRRAFIPEVEPAPAVPPDLSNPPANTNNIKPMRTYEGDVAEVMSHKGTSTASIAIAEAKRSEGQERIATDSKPSSHTVLKTLMTLLILILLGGGAFGAYYLYSKSPLAPSNHGATPQQQGRPGIVRADSYAVVAIDNQLPATILARIQTEAAKPQNPGTIKEVIVARKNTSVSTNTFTQIAAQDALTSLDIQAPDILTRTFTPDWMLGIYNSPENAKGAFVIVTTNFFQNAFAGMLQWESVMADDLKQYLYPSEVSGISNTTTDTSVPKIPVNSLADLNSILPLVNTATSSATSTATTTKTASVKKVSSGAPQNIATTSASSTPIESVQPLKSYFTLRGKFEDRIVKNKDVRAFRTDNGSILFVYSFIDNAHLAIASDEATLAEILTRLEKQALIR